MRFDRFLYLSVGIFLVFSFFQSARLAEAAFGVSPPAIRAVHLVPGAKYSQTIYLVRDIADDDLEIVSEFNLNEKVKKWFTFNNGAELIMLKGVRQYPVEVVINVPKDEPLGVYNGNINFYGKPRITGQVSIALGVNVTVDLSIGNDIYRKFNVALVDFLDIEEGWSPRVRIKFNNEGNVAETIDRAVFELYDQFGSARLAFLQKNGGFPEVPPFTIAEEIIEFPIDFHLGLGSYWGSVTFYKDEGVVASQRTVFNVLEAGSLSSYWSKVIKHFKDYKLYYSIGALLIVLAAIIFYRRKRRSSKRSR